METTFLGLHGLQSARQDPHSDFLFSTPTSPLPVALLTYAPRFSVLHKGEGSWLSQYITLDYACSLFSTSNTD